MSRVATDSVWTGGASRSIDFAAVRASVSLRQVITNDLGEPQAHGRWSCPFHDGDRPNFGIEPNGQRARCWVCGWRADVIDFVSGRQGVGKGEAARLLAPDVAGPPRQTSKPPAARPLPRDVAPKPNAYRDAAWQNAAAEVIGQAESRLWNQEGARALEWLLGRGLATSTIRRFRLGFIPEPFYTAPIEVLGQSDNGKPRGIACPRGITIPWLAPGSAYDDTAQWVGCNVRRLAPDFTDPSDDFGKYRALTGSTRGFLYPFPDVEPSQEGMPAVLTEGEFDALIGWQQAGWLAVFGTIGGSKQGPHASALGALSRCSVWLVAADHDQAGAETFWGWRDQEPDKVRRALLAHGKDLNGFHLAGGDVAAWLRSELTGVHVESEPPDWRAIVASLPHPDWIAWRRRATEILATFGPEPSAADVRLADRRAYAELSHPPRRS